MTYDKNECARLVAELREDDARMTPAPWVRGEHDDHIGGDADDPDGPCHIATTEGQAFVYDAAGIARLRNNARPVADQLEAAMAEIETVTRQRDDAASLAKRTEGARQMLEMSCDNLGAEIDRLTASLPNWDLRSMTEQRDALLNQVMELRARTVQLASACDDALASAQAERDGHDAAEIALYKAVGANRASKP